MNRLILALALALLLAIPAAAQGILPPQSGGPCDAACQEANKEKLQQGAENQAEDEKEKTAEVNRNLALAKTIRNLQIAFTHADPCDDGRPFLRPFITWDHPSDGTSLDFYRISWRVNKGWPSYKDANTRKRGNAFIRENLSGSQRFIIPIDAWPQGKTLRVRVRAGYDGFTNGPWVKVSLPWPCD